MLFAGNLRGGAGLRHSDFCDFSGRDAAVSGSLPADRMWLRLLPALTSSSRKEIRHDHCGMEITEGPAGTAVPPV